MKTKESYGSETEPSLLDKRNVIEDDSQTWREEFGDLMTFPHFPPTGGHFPPTGDQNNANFPEQREITKLNNSNVTTSVGQTKIGANNSCSVSTEHTINEASSAQQTVQHQACNDQHACGVVVAPHQKGIQTQKGSFQAFLSKISTNNSAGTAGEKTVFRVIRTQPFGGNIVFPIKSSNPQPNNQLPHFIEHTTATANAIRPPSQNANAVEISTTRPVVSRRRNGATESEQEDVDALPSSTSKRCKGPPKRGEDGYEEYRESNNEKVARRRSQHAKNEVATLSGVAMINERLEKLENKVDSIEASNANILNILTEIRNKVESNGTVETHNTYIASLLQSVNMVADQQQTNIKDVEEIKKQIFDLVKAKQKDQPNTNSNWVMDRASTFGNTTFSLPMENFSGIVPSDDDFFGTGTLGCPWDNNFE